MSTVASLRPLRGGMLRVVLRPARRSWGILGLPPLSRDLWILPEVWKTLATLAKGAWSSRAFPTPPWTALRAAHRIHRPPHGPLNGKRRIIRAAQVPREVPV
jgi:hypothetical protein